MSRLLSNDKEPKFAKSTTGIPEVSTLPLDAVASDREAMEGRNKALEETALAQDSIRRESILRGVVISVGAWPRSESVDQRFLGTRAANMTQ